MSLLGLMQKRSLLISGLLTHAATYHGDVEIVSHLYGGRSAEVIGERLPSALHNWHMLYPAWMWVRATAWPHWLGILIGTWNSTMQSQAWALFCTLSIRACFPSKSLIS